MNCSEVFTIGCIIYNYKSLNSFYVVNINNNIIHRVHQHRTSIQQRTSRHARMPRMCAATLNHNDRRWSRRAADRWPRAQWCSFTFTTWSEQKNNATSVCISIALCWYSASIHKRNTIISQILLFVQWNSVAAPLHIHNTRAGNTVCEKRRFALLETFIFSTLIWAG